MPLQFSQLQSITGGRIGAFADDTAVKALITDSRKTIPDGALFFAIRGVHHDGHQYVESLYEKGVRQFVVERPPESYDRLPEANVLVVSSALDALQAVAIYHRQALDTPVIGITGSNGKTIIKEWLYQLLSPEYRIAKNPGSYNSQLGVPLSVWQLQAHHQLGIYEAGISRVGEMEKLAPIIKPTIGVFTNLGPAHDEGFSSRQQKAEEKLKLFDSARVVVYCKDHHLIDQTVEASGLPSLSWGFTPAAGIQIQQSDQHYTVSFKGRTFTVSFPFTDPASVENCFHCIAVMLYLEYRGEDIRQRVETLQSVPMRLELKEGINQSQVIDDSYNNDLAGLRISLDFLSGQHQKTRKRLILSDILESGLEPKTLAAEIAALIDRNGIDAFVGIGPLLSAHRHMFPPGSEFYEDTDAFLERFHWDAVQQELILVKGARKFSFERIVARLQRKAHGTVMEVHLGSLVHNLNYFRAQLNPGTRVMVMVKAFAYGSGSTEIANLLQYHKVDYLGVAYADEGVDLRRNNITLPIMVMNPTRESFGTLLQHRLEPEVYSFELLHSLVSFLKGRSCAVHIKLDTGMHRLGFEEKDINALVDVLAANPHLKIHSIFSHLAGADESEHDTFSRQQTAAFHRMANQIADAVGYKPLFHVLNTPGILRFPQYQMDMVRLGIGLYGIDPTGKGVSGLKTVATLRTVVSQVKEIAEGETVGYGRRGKGTHAMKIATIAIGYADGFSRAFSNGKGKVTIRGKACPVVGNVCMDMTMVDVTGVDVHPGDEVIVFGEHVPIRDLAGAIDTIPYEILTNTSERVKRVFVAESI